MNRAKLEEPFWNSTGVLPDAIEFANPYQKWRKEYLRLPATEHLRIPLTEKHLRFIFAEKRFERRGLKTWQGETFALLDAGTPNFSDGPDFLNARFTLNGEEVCGDVEISLQSSSWQKNAAQQRERLQSVRLLVVWQNDLSGVASNNATLPHIVELCSVITSGTLERLDVESCGYRKKVVLGDCGRRLGFPGQVLSRHYEKLDELFLNAAKTRLLAKGDALRQLVAEEDAQFAQEAEKFLYQKILEALGYSKNKQAMITLARLLPYDRVYALAKAKTPDERALFLEALYLGVAGFLEDAPAIPNAHFDALSAIWSSCRGQFSAMKKSDWVHGGMRPQNFPVRRLAGWAQIFARRIDQPSFFAASLQFLQTAVEENLQEEQTFKRWRKFIAGLLTTDQEHYFSTHAGWSAKPFAHVAALIGQQRAFIIWVNAFLPVLLAASERAAQPFFLEQQLYNLWRRLPIVEMNQVAALMVGRLCGERAQHFKIAEEFVQQGLIQIFQDFCDTKISACWDCPFPKLVDENILIETL